MGAPLHDRLAELEHEQRELQAQKRRLSMDIKNEQRRKTRLLEKARGLSNEELGAIIGMRAVAEAKAKAKAKANAKAKAKAKAAPGFVAGVDVEAAPEAEAMPEAEVAPDMEAAPEAEVEAAPEP